ncbi:MAG: hypothetical protein K1X92_11565 [Bacteroidia bacterium]|nr:hypothetical protein [Bacteroidia bacterium]
MKRTITVFFLAWILFMGYSCAPSRVIRPLQSKEIQAGASLGGPLIDFAGLKIPVPFSSLYCAYGIDDKRTLFGGLHTTALAAGVGQIDIGLTQGIWRKSGWGASVSPVLNLMYGYKQFRFYPQLDLSLYKEYGEKRHFGYFSLSNWLVPYGTRAHNVKQPVNFIPNLILGNTFNRTKMNYSIEMRWLAPFQNNERVVTQYNGIGNQGTLGIYFGVARKF